MNDFVRTEEEAPSIGHRSVKFLNTIKDGESRKAKPLSTWVHLQIESKFFQKELKFRLDSKNNTWNSN